MLSQQPSDTAQSSPLTRVQITVTYLSVSPSVVNAVFLESLEAIGDTPLASSEFGESAEGLLRPSGRAAPPPHPSSAATIGAPWREGACSACPLGKCSAAAAPPSGGSSMHANLRHSDHSDRCDWQRASGSASLEFAGSCRSGSDPAVIGAIP